MPLVKGGKIATDAFVHLADDAGIPADGGILISAARFLADAEALSRLTALAAKEGGEAIAALVAASRPGATTADLIIARRETEQAVGALTNTLPMLDDVGSSSVRVTPQGGAPK